MKSILQITCSSTRLPVKFLRNEYHYSASSAEELVTHYGELYRWLYIDCLRTQAMFVVPMQAEGQRRLLVRGGTVVNADRKLEADVYCEDGIIK